MADSALSTDPLERYGEIERAYCEERWTSVIDDGQALLAELSRVDAVSPPAGLRERLQLLVAHAYLYGLGDRDNAEDFYQAVLRSEAETSLRQIAEQGLQQCGLPVAPPEPREEPEPEGPTTDPVSPQAAGLSVWQEPAPSEGPADPAISTESGPASTSVEAAPAAQSLLDSWGAAAMQAPSDESGTLSWLTVDAPAAAQGNAASPVMPWLEAPAPAAPVAAGESSAEVSAQAVDAGQGLSPETRASLQATAAAVLPAFETPAAVLEPSTAVIPIPRNEPPQTPPAAPAVVEAGPMRREEPQAIATGLSAPVVDERLVADVVDEPELIELHQAESLESDELLIAANGERLSPPSESEVAPEPPASAGLELPTGFDRRGSESPFQDRRAEQEQDPESDPVTALESAGSHPQVALSRRPFSVPPEPVAEEDPELLMGLLKIEMG